jgi:hypothetical protein
MGRHGRRAENVAPANLRGVNTQRLIPQRKFRRWLISPPPDYPGRDKRFDVVYHFLSIPKPPHPSVCVKVKTKWLGALDHRRAIHPPTGLNASSPASPDLRYT